MMMMTGGVSASNTYGGNRNANGMRVTDLTSWGTKGLITGVKVIWSTYIVGLEFLFNGQTAGVIKGSHSQNIWEENFNLMQGDHIVQIYGRGGNYINCIGFKTAKGLTKTWGNPCEGEAFTCGLNGMFVQSVKLGVSDFLNYVEPVFEDEVFLYAQRWNFSNNGKFTTALGSLHSNSEGFDDWDWVGSKFNYALGEVKIWHDGNFVHGLKVDYLLDGMKKSPGKHCSEQEGLKCETLVLNQDEHINRILVRGGQWIDGITIFTDQGRQLKAGGNGGQAHIASIPQGHHLVAFGGATGAHLDTLSIYYDEIY